MNYIFNQCINNIVYSPFVVGVKKVMVIFFGMLNLNAMGPELRVIGAHVIKELGGHWCSAILSPTQIPWTA